MTATLAGYRLTRYQFPRSRVIGDSQVRIDTHHIGALELEDDEGRTGLGFFGALLFPLPPLAELERVFATEVWPGLQGQSPFALTNRLARPRGGNIRSHPFSQAVNQALWDLQGQALGLPLYRLLGGPTRDSLRVYNTCAGYRYIRDSRAQKVANWGTGEAEGAYEDLEAFLHHADDLAHSLLEQGITAMKIWPFDVAAERSHGYDITPAELRTALEPFAKIRKAIGDKMDIMVEFHSLWSLPMAKKLAGVLTEFNTYWHEDPFRLDNIGDLKEYAQHSKAWVCASETLSYTHAFREYLETGVAGVAMLDLSWCGGLTEARKIATLAEAWHVPVAPHDCTGPVVYAASCHFSLHARNALIQESVRAFYTGWYTDLVTELPTVTRGEVTVNMKPGHGLELLPDLCKRPDAIVRVTEAS